MNGFFYGAYKSVDDVDTLKIGEYFIVRPTVSFHDTFTSVISDHDVVIDLIYR